MDTRRVWKLPSVFRELWEPAEVREVWDELCTRVALMAEDGRGMEEALSCVKSLLPWVEELWCSVAMEAAVGVSGEEPDDDPDLRAEGLRTVSLVAMDEVLREALESGMGVEKLVLERFCSVILEEQVEGFDWLLEVWKGAEEMLGELTEKGDGDNAITETSIRVSLLQVGRSVVKKCVEKKRGWFYWLYWEETEDDVADPLLWRLRVREVMAGVRVEWEVVRVEGCSAYAYAQVRVENGCVESGSGESCPQILSYLRGKREEWANWSLMC